MAVDHLLGNESESPDTGLADQGGACIGLKSAVVSLQFSSMSSQTAIDRTGVDVGERLRAIRRLRRVTLKTVADRAELSESFLSQVERGRANASVASLKRIAAALEIDSPAGERE